MQLDFARNKFLISKDDEKKIPNFIFISFYWNLVLENCCTPKHIKKENTKLSTTKNMIIL